MSLVYRTKHKSAISIPQKNYKRDLQAESSHMLTQTKMMSWLRKGPQDSYSQTINKNKIFPLDEFTLAKLMAGSHIIMQQSTWP